jgi:hypothetical protein
MSAESHLNDMLWELVGDNVGQDCGCFDCEKNRQKMREAINALLIERGTAPISADAQGQGR